MKQPYKVKAKQQREVDIVQCAREMMLKHGYANLNMDDLAEQVGISKPTLYQHFRSKEELAVRVLESDMQALERHLQQPYEGSPLERLTILLRLILKAKYTGGSLLTGSAQGLFHLIRTNERLQAQREQNMQQLAALIEQGKAQGEIKPLLPTHLILRAFFCLRVILVDPFSDLPPPLEEGELDQMITDVIHLFLNGIAVER